MRKDEGNDDWEIAQNLARTLLLPSFVCDVGWFGGDPTLRFSSQNVPNEIWLSMSGGFEIVPLQALPETLTQRQRDLLKLEAIYGCEVKAVHCRPDSRLEVLFTNDILLVALDNNDDFPECWKLRADPGGLIVACNGGGFAVWPNN